MRPVTDISYNRCTNDLWAISEDVRIHVINNNEEVGEIVVDKKINVLEFNPVVE